MATKANRTSWKPGQSGNPRGRTRGSGEVGKLRASIASDVPEILAALAAQAKAGDAAAARLLLERVVPALKPSESAQPLALPDGPLADQGRAVLKATARGLLSPGQGAQLVAAVAQLARVVEIDELERRIAALESDRDGNETET
jgi:hypothetical protein